MEKEIWMQVEGSPNYLVSNLGSIKSLDYNGTKKPKNLKPVKDRDGYLHVFIGKKQYMVHRLVANAFIDKFGENTETVDHINGIRDDNRACNLRWMSRRDNVLLGHAKKGHSINGRRKPQKPKKGRKTIPILQMDKQGVVVKEYNSLMDAERETGIGSGRISNCINNRKKSAGGYIWKRKELIHN